MTSVMRRIGHSESSPASGLALISGQDGSSAKIADDSGWLGRLELNLAFRDGRTVIGTRRHSGPLRIQRPLYPEVGKIVQLILLHPPGGLVAGDRLEYRLNLGVGSHAQFTTPGASKFYGGQPQTASSDVRLNIAPGAGAEWFPHETILFDNAHARSTLDICIKSGSWFCGWDLLCLGRTAAGERFSVGRWQQRTTVRLDDRLIWREQADLHGDDPRLQTPSGLDGKSVCGTFLLIGARGQDLPLDALQAVEVTTPAQVGVSVLPEVLVARYLGGSAQEAKNYFSTLWSHLRPLMCGRPFIPPRIWST